MATEGSVATGRLLTFRVGSGRYAVFLEEVLGVQGSAGSGAEPDHGLTFQGQPVITVDARVLWSGGASPPATPASAAVIIVKGDRGSTALMVDRVEGIVDGVEMRPLPALVAAFVRDVFRGVALDADGGRLVVDPAALSRSAAIGGQGGPGEA